MAIAFSKETKEPIVLTEKEVKLILTIREELPYARIVLITHNGQPDYIEESVNKRKL